MPERRDGSTMSSSSSTCIDPTIFRLIDYLLDGKCREAAASGDDVLPGLCHLVSPASVAAQPGKTQAPFYVRLLTFAWDYLLRVASTPSTAAPSTMRQARKFCALLCGSGVDDRPLSPSRNRRRRPVLSLLQGGDADAKILSSVIVLKYSDWRRLGDALDSMGMALRVLSHAAEHHHGHPNFARNAISALLPILQNAREPALWAVVESAARVGLVIAHHSAESKAATARLVNAITWSMHAFASACSGVFGALANIGPDASAAKSCLEAGSLLTLLLEKITSGTNAKKHAFSALEAHGVVGKLRECARQVDGAFASSPHFADDSLFSL